MYILYSVSLFLFPAFKHILGQDLLHDQKSPEAAGFLTVARTSRRQVWAMTTRVSCVLLFVCVCLIVSSKTFLRTTICSNKGQFSDKYLYIEERYGIDNFLSDPTLQR